MAENDLAEKQLSEARQALAGHRYEAAAAAAAAARAAYAVAGDRHSEKIAQYVAGVVAAATGRQEDARAQLAAAAAYFKRSGETYHAALARGALADLDVLQQPESAQKELEDVVALLRDQPDRAALAEQLTRLGRAAAAAHQWPDARAAFGEAVAIYQELGQRARLPHPMAGQASVAFATGLMATARNRVDQILDLLAQVDHNQVDDLFGVYLTCTRLLQSVSDPRAQPLLKRAQAELEERAATIEDEALRHDFLEHIPAHQALVPPDVSELFS